MRLAKLGIMLAVLGVAGIFGVTSVASAQRFTKDVSEGTVVNSTVYSTGKSVSIKGIINGDVFCFGQTVDIDATVRGDVICAGQDITVSGQVEGDVRVAGQRVSISADVRRSVSVAADTFSLDAPAKVGQDVSAVGSLLNIKGTVGRDATLSSTRSIVNGSVARNVTFSGSFLELKSEARIMGNLKYTSGSEADKSKEAVVSGKTEHVKPDNKRTGLLAFSPAWYFFVLVALLLVGLAVALMAPRTLHSVSDILPKQWGKALIAGIIASFILPIFTVLLAVTLVGIPLAAMVLLGWMILMILSGPVIGYYIGRLVLNKQKNVLLRVLLGGFILVTLYFVPLLGFFVMLGAYWLGSGALLVYVKRRLGKPRYTIA